MFGALSKLESRGRLETLVGLLLGETMRDDFVLREPGGHREFLLDIWSDRWQNRLPFDRYATWLEEQGETSAASVVNEAAHQFFAGTPASSLDPIYGEAWLELLGHPWSSEFIAQDERTKTWFRKDIRPAVAIFPTPTTNDKLEIGQSPFGGLPHLPTDFEWPQCPGFPARFLAQINFAEVADSLATSHFDLPRDGWLVVFASGRAGIQPGCEECNEHGEIVTIPNLTSLYYLPADSSLIKAEDQWDGCTEYNDLGEQEREAAVCSLSFRDTFHLPDLDDASDDACDENDVCRYLFDSGSRYNLMGWACSSRSSGFCPGPEWRNLISLGSEHETLHWNWWDDDTLNIHARIDGITNRTFTPFKV